MKPLVYISSPYSGNIEENVKKAQEYCRWAVQYADVLPIAPHLLFPQFLSEETEREKAFELNDELIERCDAVWVFTPGSLIKPTHSSVHFRYWSGDLTDAMYEACTAGMKQEMYIAWRKGKRVMLYIGDIEKRRYYERNK